MPELKGSKTEQNLRTAFAGETQARTKYDYFASKARKDGYVQIAKLFEETAANEKEHAKISSPGRGTWCGSAATAATSWWASRPPRSAPSAPIPRPISS